MYIYIHIRWSAAGCRRPARPGPFSIQTVIQDYLPHNLLHSPARIPIQGPIRWAWALFLARTEPQAQNIDFRIVSGVPRIFGARLGPCWIRTVNSRSIRCTLGDVRLWVGR